MNNGTKKCPRCGTENAPDYSFCKNCGASLDFTANAQYNYQQAPFNPFVGYSTQRTYVDYSALEPTLMGVDTKKVQAYVGEKKRDSFMQSFITMARTGKKTFFNWVVAATGLLLSPVYAAAWFFYRKMYRVALAICAISVLLTTVVTAVNYNEIHTSAEKVYTKISQMSDEEITEYAVNAATEEQSATRTAVQYVQSFISLGGVILLAMLATSIYLKCATSAIKQNDMRRGIGDHFTYAALGKPNLAPAILIPIAVNMLQSLITLAPYYGLIAKCSPLQIITVLLQCGL